VIANQPTWVTPGTVLANRLAQKGTGLGTDSQLLISRSLITQPGGKCGPKATQDEHQERGNHLGTLRVVDHGVGASQCTNPRWLGWSKKPMPRVTPGICRLVTKERQQVMSTAEMPVYEWKVLPWRKIQQQVYKLQKRIFKASRRGDAKTVHRLERLLMKSWAARCLAVRRVTQDNAGKKTSGIDGVALLTPNQRTTLVNDLRTLDRTPRPVRRVWIPKPGSTERRPLGIPIMRERAAQTLVRLALEPEWEAHFEPNSYGFRPGRSVHDAIEAIFKVTRFKPKFVLDADIAACFDQISHEALLRKLNTFPFLRRIIKGWLKAGVWNGAEFKPTQVGTPQGGALTPPAMLQNG
jgi:hypothetical protein